MLQLKLQSSEYQRKSDSASFLISVVFPTSPDEENLLVRRAAE